MLQRLCLKVGDGTPHEKKASKWFKKRKRPCGSILRNILEIDLKIIDIRKNTSIMPYSITARIF